MNVYRCLPRFEYFAPTTIDEACSLLRKYGAEAKVIAGGTDLLVDMKRRKSSPRYLIGLKGIANLNGITFDESKGLTIGAMVTLQSIVDSVPIRERFELLSTAALKISTPQIRNMGTIGGNICNASPSADMVPCLLVLEARSKLISADGERVIPIADFFVDPFKTVISEGELLAEIQISIPPPRSAGCYKWVTKRTTVDETLVGVAALIVLDTKDSICNDIRLGLCSVAPTPMRVIQAEELLRGRRIEDRLIKEAAVLAAKEADPRSRADYRRRMTEVLVVRAINEALRNIK